MTLHMPAWFAFLHFTSFQLKAPKDQHSFSNTANRLACMAAALPEPNGQPVALQPLAGLGSPVLWHHEVCVRFEFYTDYAERYGNTWQTWLSCSSIAKANDGSLTEVPGYILRKLARKNLLQAVLKERLCSGDMHQAKDVLDRHYPCMEVQKASRLTAKGTQHPPMHSLSLHPAMCITFHELLPNEEEWNGRRLKPPPTTPKRKRRRQHTYTP